MQYLSFAILLVTLFVVEASDVPQLVVISFDGFRWDYVRKFKAPTLNNIARTGVYASHGIKASFTTKTFPNYYTLATGLYIESHGIVENTFFDPKLNATFSYGNTDPRFWGGEPIWVTASRQSRKTGVFFWTGSDVKIAGRYPDFWRKYDGNVPFEERVRTVLSWLTNENVDLAMMYFNEPDHQAHSKGADSVEVEKAVEEVDSLLGQFLESLDYADKLEETNIIVVGDHGMADRSKDVTVPFIVLKDYIDVNNDADIPAGGAIAFIQPKPGKLDYVYDRLKNAHPHLQVYKKTELPQRYHYSNNDRISDIIAIADEGWLIAKSATTNSNIGNHGYDNELSSMHPIFYAMGPDFKPGVVTEPFENVNVYALMCHLLHVDPAPNNGSIYNIEHILSNQSRQRLHRKTPLTKLTPKRNFGRA